MHPKYKCHTQRQCFVLICVQVICSIVNLERDYRRKISTTVGISNYYYIVSYYSTLGLCHITI